VKWHRFHPAARTELLAAVDWYAQRDPIVATAFAQVIDTALKEIAAVPLAWPTWAGRADLRWRPLRRFPHSLVYLVDETAIVVVAVAHQKRRPGYWLRRVVSAPPAE
jgi:plasmid stabilization system protein ParE